MKLKKNHFYKTAFITYRNKNTDENKLSNKIRNTITAKQLHVMSR